MTILSQLKMLLHMQANNKNSNILLGHPNHNTTNGNNNGDNTSKGYKNSTNVAMFIIIILINAYTIQTQQTHNCQTKQRKWKPIVHVCGLIGVISCGIVYVSVYLTSKRFTQGETSLFMTISLSDGSFVLLLVLHVVDVDGAAIFLNKQIKC